MTLILLLLSPIILRELFIMGSFISLARYCSEKKLGFLSYLLFMSVILVFYFLGLVDTIWVDLSQLGLKPRILEILKDVV